jgi:glutamate-1-semialdehyde 2,1-aminomutase
MRKLTFASHAATEIAHLKVDPVTAKEIRKFSQATKKSKSLFERARNSIPSGSTRSPFYANPYPVYVEKAKGCYVFDVDGNKYIDFVCNMGPLILGHRHPAVEKAVAQQVKSFWCGAPTELEEKLAATILKAFPMGEQILFTPSGTEAMMKLIRAVRGHSGKKKIAVDSGSFHGTSDTFASEPGVPEELQNLIVRFRYNDEESFRNMIVQWKDELAAVVIEAVLGPAGSVPPTESFLKTIREETEKYGITLVFDEIVSGFRVARGGISERFGVQPDAVALGKIIGGGFPAGAFLGPKEIMDEFAYSKAEFPFIGEPNNLHTGTFNAHPVTMAAGLATLRVLTPAMYQRLEKTGDQVRKTLHKLCEERGIQHYVTGIGSIFQLHFSPSQEKVLDSEELVARLFDFFMLNRGVSLARFHSSFCSTPMGKNELTHFEKAAAEALTEVKNIQKT